MKALKPSEVTAVIAAEEGVYANFITSPEAEVIAPVTPPDYRESSLHKMALRACHTFQAFHSILPQSHELVISVDEFYFLITDFGNALHVTLVVGQVYLRAIRQILTLYRTGGLLVHEYLIYHIPSGVDLTHLANGRYLNETKIGEGGTSMVFQAMDSYLGRSVALKRFKGHGEQELHGDYLSELDCISRISHHNVVTTYDAGLDETGSYLVMELIEGWNLEEHCAQALLRPKCLLDLAAQLLEGVDAVHQAGFLHLDLKLSNIMVTPSVREKIHARIIDFGSALPCRDPDTGQQARGSGLLGSIFTVSPEYLREEAVDARSDLYSLGCLLYTAASGSRPFDGRNSTEVMAAHLIGKVRPLSDVLPQYPLSLCDWIMSLIASEPQQRPSSALEALKSLMALKRQNVNLKSETHDQSLYVSKAG